MFYDRANFVQDRGNDTIAFFIDSRYTDHLVNEKNYFCSLMILKNLIKIAIAKDKNYIEAVDIGVINVLSYVNGNMLNVP